MKYAFLVLALIFSFSTPTYAQPIKSFNDSQSILTIAQFMIDNAEDMKTSVHLSDRKFTVKDTSACVTVTTKDVLKHTQNAINIIFKFYPDEELPVEEAMIDLEAFLGTNLFKKCMFVQYKGKKTVQSSYFFDSSDTIHVKVDTISTIVR